MELLILIALITTTAIFLNYKFSKAARIIAFNEEETPTERIVSFVCVIVLSILWAFYIYFF